MQAEDFIPLLRERLKLERDKAALDNAANLRTGPESIHRCIVRAGYISALEDVDVWIVEIVKQLQGTL